MQKNLSIVNQNNKLILKKSKLLMSITNSILSKDAWIKRLWAWADQNNISDLEWITEDDYIYPCGIPRDQKELLNLMELSLSACNLQEISKEIGNLVNLRELWLDDNKLLKLPKIIGNLYDLEFLDLNGNQLSTIPKEIGKLKNLKTFILSSNELNTIPKEIGNLHSLTSLFIGRNKLIDMPIEIGKLTNLTMLYIYKNKLRNIPKEIGNLKDLTVLALSINELKKIPKEIAYLRNLTQLSLSHNQLTHIPQEVTKLDGLIKLSLAFNRMIELPKEITKLTLLTELHIYENPNLILSIDQKDWIYELIENGCDVQMDDRYKNLYEEVSLARRYDYLEKFNIGRKPHITTEILDNDIPFTINDRLANSEITFEEYLDEVAKYFDNEKLIRKEKFDKLIKKIYDRDYDLGACFERNITFQSFDDNKLTWGSHAEGDDKKMLITHWGLINMFVKDTFGFETKIVNIALNK